MSEQIDLLALLHQIEWIRVRDENSVFYQTCPYCWADREQRGGHLVWCGLAAAIAELAAVRSALPAQEPLVEMRCQWTEDEDGVWHTGCGTAFCFDTDGPAENKFNFCYRCGKPLSPTPSQEGQ